MGYSIPTKKGQLWRTGLELFCFAIMAGGVLVLETTVEPFKRGFYCDDQNINHPVMQDTISTLNCFIIWAFVCVVVIVSVESTFYFIFRPASQQWKEFRACKLPRYLLELYRYAIGCVNIAIDSENISNDFSFLLFRIFGFLTFGCLSAMLMVSIAKNTIGRLRPNFLQLCNPKKCPTDSPTEFLIEPECEPAENVTNHDLIDARKSFMSGHSAFSFYFAIFLTFYLQERLSSTIKRQSASMPKQWAKTLFTGLKIARPFLQVAMLGLALFIALSRVMDYKHHPLDVLSGGLLGSLAGYLTIYHVMLLPKKPTAYFSFDIENNVDMIDLGATKRHAQQDQQEGNELLPPNTQL